MDGDTVEERLKNLARECADDMVITLFEVANDPTAKEAARVMAADKLMQRGFGMPDRKLEVESNVHIVDERLAHLAALKELGRGSKARVVGGSAVEPPLSEAIDVDYLRIEPPVSKQIDPDDWDNPPTAEPVDRRDDNAKSDYEE